MNDLDRQIQEALDAEDRALMDRFDEQGLLSQAFSVYQGKQAWIAVIATISMFGIFVAAIYSGWRFFGAEEAMAAIRWGAAAWFFMIMVAFMKVWFWMRMETNRILREVKRIELQVARMQAKQAV